MNPDDLNNDNKKSHFEYSTDGIHFKPIGAENEMSFEDAICLSVSLSEEDAARLWAALDPLEIIGGD